MVGDVDRSHSGIWPLEVGRIDKKESAEPPGRAAQPYSVYEQESPASLAFLAGAVGVY